MVRFFRLDTHDICIVWLSTLAVHIERAHRIARQPVFVIDSVKPKAKAALQRSTSYPFYKVAVGKWFANILSNSASLYRARSVS